MLSSLSERIYKIAPTAAQHALVSVYGLYWKRLRLGGHFRREVTAFRARERYTQKQWQAYTNSQLRALLEVALQSVPHYQTAWQPLGFSARQLNNFTAADLPQLPVLEKAVACNAPHSLLAGGKPARRHLSFQTSGSTGTPVTIYWLPEEFQRSTAIREARANSFAGVSYRMPRATFSGRLVEPDPDSNGPYHRFNHFEQQVYFSAFHLRPQTARSYVAALLHHKTQWMTGYSHSIYQLARMILEQGIAAPRLKAVITTSEAVSPGMRATIEQAFSTRVYEEYAAVEDAFYVSECEEHSKHISPDAGIIEIVDEDLRPCAYGADGRSARDRLSSLQPALGTLSYRRYGGAGRAIMPVWQADAAIARGGGETRGYYLWPGWASYGTLSWYFCGAALCPRRPDYSGRLAPYPGKGSPRSWLWTG